MGRPKKNKGYLVPMTVNTVNNVQVEIPETEESKAKKAQQRPVVAAATLEDLEKALIHSDYEEIAAEGLLKQIRDKKKIIKDKIQEWHNEQGMPLLQQMIRSMADRYDAMKAEQQSVSGAATAQA